MMQAVTCSPSSADPCGSATLSAQNIFSQLSAGCALLALLTQTQSSSQSTARTDIQVSSQKLDELKEQLAEAIQAAKDAANDSGFFGFLSDVFGSDIAQIAGAVATIAAVVATGGAAAGPILLIALSEGLQLAAKVGPELGLDSKLCMALAIASVAVGFCTGAGAAQATSTLANTARDVSLVAKVAQGAATMTGGAFGFVAGQYHADQLNHQADATGIQAQEGATDLDFDDALSLLQRALRAGQREVGITSQIIQDNTDTNVALSNRI